MSEYLLASDFDNTICFWSDIGRIYDEDRRAIRRFREAGNKFVVVSGRSYNSAIEVFNEMDFHDMDLFVLMSGAYCAYPDETPVYDIRISTESLSELCEFFRSVKGRYLGLDIGKLSLSVDIGGDEQPMDTISLEEAMKYPTYTSINVGFGSREEAAEVTRKLEKGYAHIITPLQNNRAIDMPPAGMDKAVAVGRVAKMYGIENEKIYTVGDNYNDMRMLSAYHGNAMANGPEAVWQSAERKVYRISEVIDRIMSL